MAEVKDDAVDRFRGECNCSQAVLTTFADRFGMDHDMAMAIAAPFGGGIGRQREVCGAVTGMTMVLGLAAQRLGLSIEEIHADTKALCGEFRDIHGSIICRELLAQGGKELNTDRPYYGVKPCEKRVEECARILNNYIESKK